MKNKPKEAKKTLNELEKLAADYDACIFGNTLHDSIELFSRKEEKTLYKKYGLNYDYDNYNKLLITINNNYENIKRVVFLIESNFGEKKRCKIIDIENI